MNFLNLLTTSLEHTVGVANVNVNDLNFIGKIIGWIFDLFSNFYGAVALGVIVFTLALKTLVLPLDIYSRVKTKKQSLLMERMRPQMEKLQKQYSNDKNMYQQKVMELQKANGYNPLGACLPMIVSLVIFMVVLSSFSTYSNYAVLRDYSEMAKYYNESVAVYVMEDGAENPEQRFLTKVEGKDDIYTVDFEKFADFKIVKDAKEYYNAHKEDVNESSEKVITEANEDEYAQNERTKFLNKKEQDKWEIVSNFVEIYARESAAKYYQENSDGTHFGWIGNLWYPDSMLNKEVPDYAKFTSATTRAGVTVSENDYNSVTFNLSEQKGNYNGYFVLIVLSIGLMFLQQFIMMRSQKAANELSSVDGSAAKTNKWMMIIMPIMFGMFSFMYSAAFSIYMITNTLYGLITTLIINKVVTVRFANREIKTASSRPSSKAKRLKK
ncbi:MAG: YidC/Oxa1 family membrane protein insertase [Clostridia bacterium]|nr:YidC/Oxa1 family membrane protein insertase [Clostridia bacterium]